MRSAYPRLLLALAFSGVAGSAGQALAAPPDAAPPDAVPPNSAPERESSEPQPTDLAAQTDEGSTADRFFTVDYSGYLRWRNDLFYRGDLGAGVGGIRTPLENSDLNQGVADSSDVLAGSNLRFRFAPTIRVAQMFRIKTVIDVLDNLVLGSTPDYHPDRADVPITALADGQAAVGDGIAVKQLWLEWEFFHGFVLSAGRMPDGFGLGMVTSSGDGLDSDFGDSTDRFSVLFRAFGFHSLWYFDSPFEGATSLSRIDGYGQAHDLSSVDDAIRWGFTIGMRPLDSNEEAQAQRDLKAGKPVLQFALKNSFTTQEFESVAIDDDELCTEGSAGYAYDCVRLLPREASLWVPDLWARLDWRPRHDLDIRIEIELAGIVGDFAYVQNRDDIDSAKDILGMGGVLQTEIRHGRLTYSLEFGGASGDDVAFGPHGQGFTSADDAAYAQDARLVNNRTITRFLFSRDYRVDLILYREILGAVTDSFYVKPTVAARLLDTEELRVGGSLSVLYAQAFLAEPTPGHDNPLGVETDLNLYIEQGKHLRVDLDAGILFPLSGLDNATTSRSAKTAVTVQARLGIIF